MVKTLQLVASEPDEPPPHGLKDAGERNPKSGRGQGPCQSCAIRDPDFPRPQHLDIREVGCKIKEQAWIAVATVSVVKAGPGWLQVGGCNQASIREAKKACGCEVVNCDWLTDINWRIPGNLPIAMAHRRRLDAQAHAVPENSPILD